MIDSVLPPEDGRDVEWMQHGSCLGLGELWWTELDGKMQKQVCASCPVIDDCLAYAMDMGTYLAGVWGGTTQNERSLRLRAASNTTQRGHLSLVSSEGPDQSTPPLSRIPYTGGYPSLTGSGGPG